LSKNKERLYIILISVHGLIRGSNLELGRDADTGGQTTYVVELAKALAQNPEVDRVDLLTRRVIDPKVDESYAQLFEEIAPGANIVRIPCGPRRYLRKEVLWPYMDSFADGVLRHLRLVRRIPNWIHSHYADAGYVGVRVANLLGIPLIHTGHSLGRIKRQRLMAKGMKEQNIESRYNMTQRIEAEENTLENASLMVASTYQEVEEQYSLYDNYQPKYMKVLPPGTDLERFRPPRENESDPPYKKELARFLADPDKPMILALSRPDERKNISTLIEAFGENPKLRSMANLVIVAGNRNKIQDMEKGPRRVLTSLLMQVDQYDLYGSVAYPKQHQVTDVPDLYRLAAKTEGIFVNPAVTEPFGLTLIEAAASGLPMVATENGGPQEIVLHCKNGLLVDPLDSKKMGDTMVDALSDRKRWQQWSEQGVKGSHLHYSWPGHVEKYLKACRNVLNKEYWKESMIKKGISKLPTVDRILLCDIDNTLTGDVEGLRTLLEMLNETEVRVGFGVATGRRLESTREILKEWNIPLPDILITSVGSEISYGRPPVEDSSWRRHINFRWDPEKLREAVRQLPGIRLQPQKEQREHKISFYVDPDKWPGVRKIRRLLRKQNLQAQVIYSHGEFLDLLPIRASKGLALRFLSIKWGIPLQRFLVAGDSGNDREMLTGNTLAVVVGNYSRELASLKGRPCIYFAEEKHAGGIVEGIQYYDFFGDIRIPNLENGGEPNSII